MYLNCFFNFALPYDEINKVIYITLQTAIQITDSRCSNTRYSDNGVNLSAMGTAVQVLWLWFLTLSLTLTITLKLN